MIFPSLFHSNACYIFFSFSRFNGFLDLKAFLNFIATSNEEIFEYISVYTNGNSIDHHNMSGPGSLGDSSSAPESMSPPPDLPELPDLPPLPPMGMPVGPGPEVAPYGPMAAYGAHPSYAMHPSPPPAAPYPAGTFNT